MAPISTKQSFGVACCRIGNDGRPEILLVCKRYTYAFNMFVHGKYQSKDDATIMELLNGMTVDEKVDLLSLNFTQIWYRIWLKTILRTSYYVSKSKFENNFVADGGIRLNRMIGRSTNSTKIWEIPKGRRRNKVELDLQCAIREFTEETAVPKKMYKVYPQMRRSYAYIDAGTRYENTYYAAIMRGGFEPRVNLSSRGQIDELLDIRWMNIEQVRMVDHSARLERFIVPIFRYIKKHN